MFLRAIPKNAIEIQPGLWASEIYLNYKGLLHVWYDLYSSENFRFWNVQQPENYDENGKLVPLEQRVLLQYAATAYSTLEELNENFKSVQL